MGQNLSQWIRHHVRRVAIGLAVVGMTVGAVFFPHSGRGTLTVTVLTLALMVAWAQTPLPRPKSLTAGIPPLTIRDHLKRTNAVFVRIMVPLLCGWIVVVTLFLTDIPKPQRQAWAIGGGVVLAFIGSMFIRARLRCPRCGSDFRKERITQLGRWSFDTRTTTDLWDACPRCGVSFDEPYP
jgi:ribosomal protein S27AE